MDTTASFSAARTYVPRLTANDGQFARSDDATITVQSGPATPTTQQLNSVSYQNTGEKPQSKVWKYAGAWWSVFPNASGTWVWRLDNTTWNPVFRINTRTAGKADVLPVGDVAHVLLFDGSSSTRLASLQYVPGSPGTYGFWSRGLPCRPFRWAAAWRWRRWRWTRGPDVGRLRRRLHDRGPLQRRQLLHLERPRHDRQRRHHRRHLRHHRLPNGSVGVIWSSRTRSSSASAPTPPARSDELVDQEKSRVAVGGERRRRLLRRPHEPRGHLHRRHVYAAVKTNYDTSGQPVIGLLVRRPTGVWDNFYSVDTDLGDPARSWS